jgi:ABC-type multidrug transport system permease subunit
MKIAKIIHKNLKLLMRSKGSVITTLIGPLVVIFLVGLAFGNITTTNINVGIYAPNYNELTDSFVDRLENQSFKIVKYPVQDLCINEIKKGTIHTCIFFPANFAVGGNQSSTIEFYVDETNVNVVSMVKEAVSKQVESRLQELSEDLTEDVLSKIDDVKNSAEEQIQLITQLIDDSNSINSEINDASEDISAMEIDFKKSDLTDGLDDLETDLDLLNDRGKGAVNDALDLVDDIQATDYSAAADSSTITSLLNSAEDDFEDILDDFNESNINAILTKIQNVSAKVSEINSKMNTADATKNNVRDNLVQVKQDISRLQDNLLELQRIVETMTGNVGNVQVTSASGIVAPVKTLVKPVVAEKAPLHYMLPSLIVLVIMFISMMLAGTLVVMEKTSSAFFRNFVTPTNDVIFLYGTFFTNLIVVGLQMILVLLASLGVFQAAILNNLGSILIVIFLSIGLYTIIGMIIGYLFHSQEMVSLGGISVGSLFLLMSNVIFPLEQMPEYMIKLARFNPFIISESLLRKAILFNTDIIYLINEIFLLFAMIVILFLILVGIEKVGKNIFLTGVHFLKHKKYSTLDKDKLEELKKQSGITTSDDKDKKGKKKGDGPEIEDRSQETPDEEPDYQEMDVPKKENFFSKFFKKSGKVFDDAPNMLKDEVEEFVKEEESKKGVKKGTKGKKEEQPKKPTLPKGKVGKAVAKAVQKVAPKKDGDAKEKVKKIINKIAGKPSEEEQNNPLLSKLEPHQYFVLSSGNIVKSYKELVQMLDSMDSETFQYHVGKDKNDFYLWIKNVLKAEDVAKKIEKTKDRKSMSKILKKFL